MGILDKFLKRSNADGQIYPNQYYDTVTDEMTPVATDKPMPVTNTNFDVALSELKTALDNIKINADSVNLNTDTLEQKILDLKTLTVLAAGANTIGNVGVNLTGVTSLASKTRPDNTTAYAVNDVVGTDAATNLEFSNVYGTSGAEIIINRVELRIDVNSPPAGMAGFKLHLYDSSPTAIADNAAFNLPAADRAKYLGFIDIDTPVDYGDTLYVNMLGVNFQCKLATASTTLYGMLVTNAAYTPTALVVKTVKLHSLGV